MAVNVIALMALAAGIYLAYQADKQKKQAKALYSLAGLITLLWSLSMLFIPYAASTALLPLVFGLASIGALHSKGGTQAVFAALALVVFLSVVV